VIAARQRDGAVEEVRVALKLAARQQPLDQRLRRVELPALDQDAGAALHRRHIVAVEFERGGVVAQAIGDVACFLVRGAALGQRLGARARLGAVHLDKGGAGLDLGFSLFGLCARAARFGERIWLAAGRQRQRDTRAQKPKPIHSVAPTSAWNPRPPTLGWVT